VRIRHLGTLALRPIRHTLAAAAALVLALAYAPGALADDAGGRPGKTNVTVMTRNLYLGADLGPAITAPNLPQFLAATSAIWTHVQQVSFPERARVLADEIAHAKPDLVGLQEAAMWRTGPIGDPAPATTVVYDYLALLLAELRGAGIKPIKSELVGNDPRNRTPGGLWPSDHLGHVATLRIG
jgi:hypothetical protein